MFDIRHDALVSALEELPFEPPVKVGTYGRVIALKIVEGKPQYLVKWKGRAAPTVAWREQLSSAI